MHSVCEADLRVGGQYRIEMHSDKGAFVVGGTYEEIVPNERLPFTWRRSLLLLFIPIAR